MDGPLLSLSGLTSAYGGIEVLHQVDLIVAAGEIVCLLGRNGAGKTTTIRGVNGLHPPMSGTIKFDGVDITHATPEAIVRGGIATVPEGRRIFASMSVEENLLLGAYSRRTGMGVRANLDPIFDMFPRLAERRRQTAGTLSGGEQQMVAMGRALMSHPRLLLLDEPSMGLAPMLIEAVFDTIDRLASQGITILLVEQNASEALDVADRAYVLEGGSIVKSGSSADLQSSADIRDAYLGVL